ncbi:MAG: HNH endonuclease [Chthoniobacter sp.]|nr:HNH endonuclease [Chthoniobacter sp.]
MITEDGDIINEYNTVKFCGIMKGGHVWAYLLHSGRLPSPGEYVIHGCDRKCCCNSAHVRSGTPKENHTEAVQRGLIDPQAGKGGLRPQVHGQRNPYAKTTNAVMAVAKWLHKNPHLWFTSEISAHHSLLEAIGILLNLTVPALKQMTRRESWRSLEASPPQCLPTVAQIPPDAQPPAPKKNGKIGPDNAALMLKGYWESEDRPRYIREWATRLKVSIISVQKVLCGESWPEIEPQIAREKNFASHRPNSLSERDVQTIRATFKANPNVRALKAALARKFGCEPSHVQQLILGLARRDVPDDDSAIISLDQLVFKPSAQRGEAHKLAVLSPDQVWQIHTRRAAGESANDLALEFRISLTRVYNILKGKAWREIWERFQQQRGNGDKPGEGKP